MKTNTLFGIILGIAAIFGAYLLEGGKLESLLSVSPMIIVLGGTFAAGLAGTSFKTVATIPTLVKIILFPKEYDFKQIVDQLVYFSQISRREGILALENKLDTIKYPFLRKMVEISTDGSDPQTLEQIFRTEIGFITERHYSHINLFAKFAGYSPTMGIIGTVMGLILTFANAGEDINTLIQHIGTAFIATMWGIFMANIVWLPISDRLKFLHDEEMQAYELMLLGVQGLMIGQTPTVIHSRLVSIFPITEQIEILKKGKPKDLKPNEPLTPPQKTETPPTVGKV